VSVVEEGYSIMTHRVIESKAQHLKTYLTCIEKAGSLPGLHLSVLDEQGDVVFNHVNGKFDESTIYRIYSNSKPVTAVAAMILIDRGMLSLDLELGSIIPSFTEMDVVVGGTVDEPLVEPVKTPITIQHLLTHTSGITYAIFDNDLPDQILKKNIGSDASALFGKLLF
jgi:CubicO group peptidase (beta-lactamase class C family)